MTLSSVAPTTDHVALVHAGLDVLAQDDFDALSVRDQAELLTSLNRAEARMAAIKLRVIASAGRSQAARASGMASMGQWAAKVSNLDQVTAHREVVLAQGLETRAVTQRALSVGVISADHASVILQADRNLPIGVSAVERDRIEVALIEKARVLAPGALRRAARRALEAVEPDPVVVDAYEDDLVRTEEEQARAKTRLTLHDNGDGTVTGRFTVPTLHGELLRKIIATITAPRRGRLGASRAQVGAPEVRTEYDRAAGAALCELIEHLPTDHLYSKTAATLIVKIDEPTMRGALKVAGLDTGGVLSAGEARRLACNSGLMPAVLNGQSQVLDLGRMNRLFSEPQRIAKGLEYDSCAADGCERPYAWCELHHQVHWQHGGRTDLKDAIPLCHFHHQQIHAPGYWHAQLPNGRVVFHCRI